MITADEARKMSNEAEEAILSQPRFKTLFAELERRIRLATEHGDRIITWTDTLIGIFTFRTMEIVHSSVSFPSLDTISATLTMDTTNCLGKNPLTK